MSLNTWAYGGANPITMVDPTGMRAVTLHEGGCGSLGEKDCRDAVDSFIELEDEDPGYWAGSFTGPPKAPPPPEPPSPAAVEMVMRTFGITTGAGGLANDFSDYAIEGGIAALDAEAFYITRSAGSGFSTNRGADLWLAKAAQMRRLARYARWGGAAAGVVGGYLDYREYRSAGDSWQVAAVKSATVGAATLAGGAAGAYYAAGTCAATVVLAPVSWACGLAGAVVGGAAANFASSAAVDKVDDPFAS